MGKSNKQLWAKLAMCYYDDAKFDDLNPLAELLYVRAISFGKKDNTGVLSRGAVARLCAAFGDPAQLAGELVAADLFRVDDDGQYVIANWSEWQEDRSKVEAKSRAGKRGAEVRWQNDGKRIACATDVPMQERETEREINTLSPDGFDEFWLAYPRKVAKADAVKAWSQTAKKRPPIPVLLAALETARAGWSDPRYVPYPASWLRGQRWDDFGAETGVQRRLRPDLDRLVGLLAPLRAVGADDGEVSYTCSGFAPDVVEMGLGWFRGGEIPPEGYETVTG